MCGWHARYAFTGILQLPVTKQVNSNVFVMIEKQEQVIYICSTHPFFCVNTCNRNVDAPQHAHVWGTHANRWHRVTQTS